MTIKPISRLARGENPRAFLRKREVFVSMNTTLTAKEIARHGCTFYCMINQLRMLLKMNMISKSEYKEMVEKISEYYGILVIC